MRSVAENLIRASMTSVDIWRAIETLEAQGWNEQAIADALALAGPHRPPPQAAGASASGDARRHGDWQHAERGPAAHDRRRDARGTGAGLEEAQAEEGPADVAWYEVARALAKRRMPFSAAKFGDDLAKAYGVVWEDDLFAPAGEDGRYTTNVEGFFGAQQEWLQNNLPERGTLLPSDEYGQRQLPKKAERVYGKPGKTRPGRALHRRAHRRGARPSPTGMPEPKKAGKAGKGGEAAGGWRTTAATADSRTRPDVTQKGVAMIGDLRTDALHQALADTPIDDDTLLAPAGPRLRRRRTSPSTAAADLTRRRSSGDLPHASPKAAC